MKGKKVIFLIMVLALFLGIHTSANAASATVAIEQIGINSANVYVIITIGGVTGWYKLAVGSNTKAALAIALTAYSSGKKVEIYYDGGTINAIFATQDDAN